MTKPQRRMIGGLNGDSIIVDDAKSVANCKTKLGIEITRHENVVASSETKLQP